MIKIAPSILSADFSNLEKEIKSIEKYADFIHVDVMDGHFVPNITVGPLVVTSLSKITKLPLDVHLMIENPDKYIESFARAGSKWITIHQETCNHIHRTIQFIKKLKIKAGIALNPATPVNTLTHILPDIDLVLIMSVNPGFGGQEFIPHTLKKIEELKNIIIKENYQVLISVDGGVKLDNAKKVAMAGADILVAGSEVFNSKNPAKRIVMLQKACE